MLRFSFLLVCLFSYGYAKNATKCAVSSFKMQQNFNINDFLGEWNLISFLTRRTGLTARRNMDRNVKRHFTFDPSTSTLGIRTDFERYMTGCNNSVEEASLVPMSNLSKFTVTNQGSNEQYGKSLWILRTDNVGFAVIYSCDFIRMDGTCDPDKQVIYTMNRSDLGHTQDELTQIDDAIRSVCVDPAMMTSVVQDGNCWDSGRQQQIRNYWRNWVDRMGLGHFWATNQPHFL